jgi:D-xylose transport system permease protein
MWAEVLIGGVGSALVIGAVMVMNAYPWPKGIVRQYAAANNIEVPEGGLFISHGFAIPVLIAIAVGISMTFLSTRTRFGRYVFAIGGNPEAAELAGINTKRMTMLIFALMGALVGISAVIASARLNSATNALGQLDELYVIAAAVIGGTSFAGGIGTIYGAMLGALVMQSLQSGMVLVGFDAAVQQMVVGCVLVAAVWLDTLYRRNSA